MRKKNKLVHGVGINDYNGSISMNGKHIKSYSTWKHMIGRCYSEKLHNNNPTYIGCMVCNEWKSFNNFKSWFDMNYKEGFDLDKDILVEGNKIYSPDACRFIPHYLNSILTHSRKRSYINKKSKCPIGVLECFVKGQVNVTYNARVRDENHIVESKNFKTIEEASAWYSEIKKRVVKEQAIRAFLDNAIKTDIYLALVRRTF